MQATAQDSDGRIVSVLLLLNNQRLAVLDQAPYIWPAKFLTALSNMAEGNYTLQAMATDNQGATQTATVDFAVSEPNTFPTINFNTPANHLTLPVNSSLNVSLNASDLDGTITGVALFINDIFISEITTPPYKWPAQNTPPLAYLAAGTYILKAIATDNKNGQSTITRELSITNTETTDGDPAQGKQLYLTHCLNCHGQFGEGVATNPALLPIKSTYGASALTLLQTIEQTMPLTAPIACTDQCARNIASYLLTQLSAEANHHHSLIPNANSGQMQYALHCASCHGNNALGTTNGPVLLPIRTEHDYTLKTFEYFAQTNAFTMIDIGMPLAANRYPEGAAQNCSGQCAADVLAYLTALTQALTPEEQKQLQITRGQQHYEQSCSRCHGADGTLDGIFGITAIIPLSSDYKNNNTLDEADAFYVRNRDTMPPKDAQKCEGQCAKDVSVYIREVLN